MRFLENMYFLHFLLRSNMWAQRLNIQICSSEIDFIIKIKAALGRPNRISLDNLLRFSFALVFFCHKTEKYTLQVNLKGKVKWI